ncbi:hypothetical protein O181_027588 [Austropuccinia psidii MF-1]|uniref:Uncharacterized protein n=1 Tax=Austropuccinia psidii MF-1 TaxID=1389203 RepID=A0A9Q3CS37_9BASI|nr:hypothetical protein [Austropuccinia psidii MF-1]
MSHLHLSNLGISRNQPEDRQGLFRNKIPGSGHHNRWQSTEGNNTHNSIHLPIQQRPQTKGIKGYGSSSSSLPTPQRLFPMEHGQHKVQPSFTLGITWSRLPEDISQRDTLQKSYGKHQRM